MARQEKQDHQPEPWMQNGRYILDASGWTLASARFPADARRIVAAINAVQGIPTDALESWFVNVIGEPAVVAVAAGDRPESSLPETFPDDRRSAERRRGDRRATRPRLRIFGAEPTYGEHEEEKGSR
jgi:hypothetical protein